MASKFFCVLVLALVSQGYARTETILDEESINYITHDLIGTSFGISKSFSDRLLSCHIVFPNGIIYEAYPEDRIPHDKINFSDASEPFRSCVVSLKGVSVEDSGTYELYSVVESGSDLSQTLTRKKFTINVININ